MSEEINWSNLFKIYLLPTLVGIGGWLARSYYEIHTSKPKIKGRILQAMTGIWAQYNINRDMIEEHNTILLAVSLTNERKNIVTILDYELYIDYGEGFKRVKKLYGVKTSKNWNFTLNIDGVQKEYVIPDFQEKGIDSRLQLVKYGEAIVGFILFVYDDIDIEKLRLVNQFKLICIDVFDRRHEIITETKNFTNFYLVQDIMGIKTKLTEAEA